MALSSFQLFLKQVQQSPEDLKIRVLHVIFDIMMVHEGDFLGNPTVGVRILLLHCLLSLKCCLG